MESFLSNHIIAIGKKGAWWTWVGPSAQAIAC
jgi:hypothetical protein